MSSASNNSNNDKTTATVRLNVGGTKYEVSRSLIEQYPDTMLARLISKEWDQEKANEDLFIDRNGKRFEFVLDYMRDQKVCLPTNAVSKDTLLQELEYFGFNDVSPDIIDSTLAAEDAVAHMQAIHDQYKTKLDQYKTNINRYKTKIDQGHMDRACLKIAYRAHTKQLEANKDKFRILLKKEEFNSDEWLIIGTSNIHRKEFESTLKVHLDAYGLRLRQFVTSFGYCAHVAKKRSENVI